MKSTRADRNERGDAHALVEKKHVGDAHVWVVKFLSNQSPKKEIGCILMKIKKDVLNADQRDPATGRPLLPCWRLANEHAQTRRRQKKSCFGASKLLNDIHHVCASFFSLLEPSKLQRK
jgi:hypothetical protein